MGNSNSSFSYHGGRQTSADSEGRTVCKLDVRKYRSCYCRVCWGGGREGDKCHHSSYAAGEGVIKHPFSVVKLTTSHNDRATTRQKRKEASRKYASTVVQHGDTVAEQTFWLAQAVRACSTGGDDACMTGGDACIYRRGCASD